MFTLEEVKAAYAKLINVIPIYGSFCSKNISGRFACCPITAMYLTQNSYALTENTDPEKVTKLAVQWAERTYGKKTLNDFWYELDFNFTELARRIREECGLKYVCDITGE